MNKINSNSIPLSLYIHIPWCIKKCPYCDFNSHNLGNNVAPEKEYIAVLEQDLISYLPFCQDRVITSIFFGGGTPSLFSPEAIAEILEHVKKYYTLAADIEITLEANPGTVEQQRFQGFKMAGVNRISLGVQSFNEEMLKRLGRIHGSDEAKKAICAAQTVGFDNINIDLMYGLPHQSIEQSCNDLATALSFKPQHISWYQLTLEPNTLFHHKPPPLPQHDQIVAMEQHGRTLLEQHNFTQYEISAWTKSKICKHNKNIWQFTDYMGIGAGACGKITYKDEIFRTTQPKHPKLYLSKKNGLNKKNVQQDNILFEFMLNHLRLKRKLMFIDFESRTGLARENIIEILASADQSFFNYNNEFMQLTERGFSFYNDVVAIFLNDIN